MEHLKWPPYKKENYVEYDAKNPTIENGLVIDLIGEERNTTTKRQNTNKEDR